MWRAYCVESYRRSEAKGMVELKRSLSLFDATAMALGAIIGAGIFVISGVAAGLAGPAVIVAIMIAGGVSSFTAFSFVRLSSKYAQEGGPYVYAKYVISDFAGFITGWIWLFANVVAGATVSIGLASYVIALFPQFPLVPIAVSGILILTVFNIVGIKQSSIFNVVLVLLKLSALALFIIIGSSHLNFSLYQPFVPNGISGVLSAAALIFFAYTGFGRPATAAEEIKDPTRTIPRSIVLSLVLSSIVYILVGIVSIGLIPYQDLANSGSPLSDAISHGTNIPWLKVFVSFAAIVATVSVLLTTVIGVSRVSFAMARDGLLPKFMSKTHNRFATPYLAVLVSGVVMAILPMISGLKQIANVTNFGSLTAYALVNLCAIILVKRESIKKITKRSLVRLAISSIGLVSCVSLLYFLSPQSWLIGFSWIAIGILYFMLKRRWTTRGP
jgi:APA family basic amino acid/polyamine antiporter